MRLKSAITISTSLAFLITPSAHADLVGLYLRILPGATEDAREILGAANVAGAANANVYLLFAIFDDGPLGTNDQIVSVKDVNLSLASPRQRFFQAPAGGDTPPDSAMFVDNPALQFDTFATLGLLTSTSFDTIETQPQTKLTENEISGGWFNAQPQNMLGQPTYIIDGLFIGTPIAQITVLSDCPINRLYLEGEAVPISTGPTTVNPLAFILDPPPITDIEGNSTGVVNGEDIGSLMTQWGPAENCETADFNDDGVVNGLDLAMMLATWSR